MNKEQIIQMARDAGMRLDKHNGGFVEAYEILRFAAAIRAATKEEDAIICDEYTSLIDGCTPADCSAAIRGSSK